MDVQKYVQQILNSYHKWFQTELVQLDEIEKAKCVIVAHDGGLDPILNYGNEAALDLWELTWEELIITPSRFTAEADVREKRDELLRAVEEQGFVKGYEGIRVSRSGKRFWIRDVKIWNVLNDQNKKIGQAATFSEVEYI